MTSVCDKTKSKGGIVKVSKYDRVRSESVSQFKAATTKGVVSVAVASSSSVFKQYKSGILNTKDCGTSTHHFVNMVGYGSSGTTQYWIIRNSWGSKWGDNGYIKIAIQEGIGICAIQSAGNLPYTN